MTCFRLPSSALGLCLALALPTFAQAGAAPEVKLVDAGKGDKSVLRMAPKTGQKNTMTMTTDMSMGMSMAGETMPPRTVPTMTMTMTSEISEVKAEGAFTTSFVYTAVEVADSADPQMAPAVQGMRSALAGLVGVEGHITMDSRGFMTDGSIAPAEGTSPELRDVLNNVEQMLTQATPPLPVEPVGLGAVWTVASQIENQGMTVTQVGTYTLRERKGSVVVVDIKLTQTAKDQVIKTPQGDAKLKSLDTTGTGWNKTDLGRGTAVEGTVETASLMSMGMDMGGQALDMDMDMKMKMGFSNKAE